MRVIGGLPFATTGTVLTRLAPWSIVSCACIRLPGSAEPGRKLFRTVQTGLTLMLKPEAEAEAEPEPAL